MFYTTTCFKNGSTNEDKGLHFDLEKCKAAQWERMRKDTTIAGIVIDGPDLRNPIVLDRKNIPA